MPSKIHLRVHQGHIQNSALNHSWTLISVYVEILDEIHVTQAGWISDRLPMTICVYQMHKTKICTSNRWKCRCMSFYLQCKLHAWDERGIEERIMPYTRMGISWMPGDRCRPGNHDHLSNQMSSNTARSGYYHNRKGDSPSTAQIINQQSRTSVSQRTLKEKIVVLSELRMKSCESHLNRIFGYLRAFRFQGCSRLLQYLSSFENLVSAKILWRQMLPLQEAVEKTPFWLSSTQAFSSSVVHPNAVTIILK